VSGRAVGPVIIGFFVLVLVAVLIVPMLAVGGISLLFADGTGGGCGLPASNAVQPQVSTEAANSIPADYLKWFQKVGLQYNVPWTVLAGIAKVESDDGRTTLPGVTQATTSNAFGAAGPMQIGIGGASTNQWGGAPVHPASEVVNGVATDEDGDGTASVYDPADAIAGAAKYLVEHGVQQNPSQAIFAYNHADWYVQEVLTWASTYASGGFTVVDTTAANAPKVAAAGTGGQSNAQSCVGNSQLASFTAPNPTVLTAVSFAEQQLGKPYLFGGTGPAAFDCSGLTMMAYRAAGVNIARTSQQQYATLPAVPANEVRSGDLVFFAGSDGTVQAPGHVGIVIGKNQMIEAYATGTPIRISSFGTPQSPKGDNVAVGFRQPWPGPVVAPSSSASASSASMSPSATATKAGK
jgi:cell wall-associated NlpC family hydrolase